jgi:hypothetical protein
VLAVPSSPVPPTARRLRFRPEYEKRWRRSLGARLGAVDKLWRRYAQSKPICASPATSSGHPVQEIVDRAEHWGADLIVVGSHGYRGFKRLLLGSVSQAVASHAQCSVEIVRSKLTASGSHE